jgi:hypothetical protein
MLSFLISVAVCIWIVERIVHLSAPWRERRRFAREIREINAEREAQRLAELHRSRQDAPKFVADDLDWFTRNGKHISPLLVFLFVVAAMAILH